MEYDAPPNSLKDSNASPKMETTEGVGICYLTHSIWGVRRLCNIFGMRTKMSDKQVNYSYQSAQTKQQVG
jgi:hypothetical protein